MEDKKDFKNINQVLKFHRTKNGYSFRKLAEILEERYEVKVGKSTIFRIEMNNFKISADLLFILADLYNINLNELKKFFVKNKH